MNQSASQSTNQPANQPISWPIEQHTGQDRPPRMSPHAAHSRQQTAQKPSTVYFILPGDERDVYMSHIQIYPKWYHTYQSDRKNDQNNRIRRWRWHGSNSATKWSCPNPCWFRLWPCIVFLVAAFYGFLFLWNDGSSIWKICKKKISTEVLVDHLDILFSSSFLFFKKRTADVGSQDLKSEP